MIRHGCACGFHYAIGINSVMRTYSLLQRRVTVTILPVNFELLQIDRQFAKRKWGNTARREIETRTTLRLRPMHVVGMLVSHELVQCNTNNETSRQVKKHSHCMFLAPKALSSYEPGATPQGRMLRGETSAESANQSQRG